MRFPPTTLDEPCQPSKSAATSPTADAQLDNLTYCDDDDLGDLASAMRAASGLRGSGCQTTPDMMVRPFLARILGWSDDRAIVVNRAQRSIRLAATRHAALVLCGEGDLVPIAAALHRRVLGPSAPFGPWFVGVRTTTNIRFSSSLLRSCFRRYAIDPAN
jgi:hypothetical protein